MEYRDAVGEHEIIGVDDRVKRGYIGACGSGGVCRKCGKEGHCARDCWQSVPIRDLRRQDGAEPQRAQGRVYLRTTEGDGAVPETAAGMMLS